MIFLDLLSTGLFQSHGPGYEFDRLNRIVLFLFLIDFFKH